MRDLTGQRKTARFPAVDGSQPCAGRAVDEFFHEDGARGDVREALEFRAKALCRPCPWVRECLAWALENEHYGVWGASTEDERQALRRRFGLVSTPPETMHRPPSRAERDDEHDEHEHDRDIDEAEA